ncbi:MAG TPA: hypothetical protein VGE13_01010 [Candidatus Saccharimonadales bacterium]
MVTKKTSSKSRATSATKRKAAPTKSRASKATAAHTRAKKTKTLRSFRIERQSTPFMTTATSRETVYWLILGIVVIAFTAWIMKLQSDIQSIYDSIDLSNNTVLEIPHDHADHKKKSDK